MSNSKNTWGFNIWAPTGYSKGSRTPDNSFVFRSGLRMQVTPEGDCREATFQAKGAGLGIAPLDCVQVTWNGEPIFYGEVRVGGNPYDVNGHQVTLRSAALRLREITIPEGWSAPQQNAGATVRSMMQAVLAQLGGTITIGEISLPFDCRPIVNAQQQNPYALLEQIAADGAGMGVKVRFGVNARREFYCVVAREDTAALNNEMLTGQTHFVAPVAETPVTAVRWFVSKKMDGSWHTHLSIAPEASVYGLRVKAISLDSDKDFWEIVRGGQWDSLFVDADGVKHAASLSADQIDWLTDGNTAGNSVGAVNDHDMRFTYSPNSPVTRYHVSARAVANPIDVPADKTSLNFYNYFHPQQKTYTPVIGAPGCGWQFSENDWRGIIFGEGTSLNGYMYSPPGFEYQPFGIDIDPGVTTTFSIYEMRPERLKTELLDQLARFHYSIPATAPADLELRDFTGNRAGRVTYNGWQSPVDAYEYRLTAARGMTTGILAGQADDPTKLAQNALIKARDQRAVISAITSNV